MQSLKSIERMSTRRSREGANVVPRFRKNSDNDSQENVENKNPRESNKCDFDSDDDDSDIQILCTSSSQHESRKREKKDDVKSRSSSSVIECKRARQASGNQKFDRGLSEEQNQQRSLLDQIISPSPDRQSPSVSKSPGVKSQKTPNKLKDAAIGTQKITCFFSPIPPVSLRTTPIATPQSENSRIQRRPSCSETFLPSESQSMTKLFSNVTIDEDLVVPRASEVTLTLDVTSDVEVEETTMDDVNLTSAGCSSPQAINGEPSSSPDGKSKDSEDPKDAKPRRPRRSRKPTPSSQPKPITKPPQPSKPEPPDLKNRDRLSMTLFHLPTEDSDDDSEPEDSLSRQEKLLRVPTMVVVDPSIATPTQFNERIRVVQKFEPSLPKGCSEARKGKLYGSWNRKRERRIAGEKFDEEFPGVPNVKYGPVDNEKIDAADSKALRAAKTREERREIEQRMSERPWIVQALFECPEDPDRCRVLYEGWSSDTMSIQRTDETGGTAPKTMKVRLIRETFLAKARENAEVEARELVAKNPEMSFETALTKFFVDPPIESLSPTSRFWLYRDMEYFHTKHQEEHLLGPIWYMSMRDPEQLPPFYAYTPVNIVEKKAFEKCRDSMDSLSTKQLIAKLYSRHTFQPGLNETCSNPKGCRCNQRFNILYGRDSGRDRRPLLEAVYQPIKNLKHDSKGFLDLRDFTFSDLRVIMECSDECGCDHECPRRRLQQGQVKPMVVYHEGAKGFGLRAAEGFKKGELVCEYTGYMFCMEPLERQQVQPHAYETVCAPYKSSSQRSASQREGDPDDSVASMKEETPPKQERNTSYQAGFAVMTDEIVICAKEAGSIARFINHSCDPNTAFFEVHSRRYVKDPLIPRVAVYATKDIALGEEITIAYWDPTEERLKTSHLCRCGSPMCMKYLPS